MVTALANAGISAAVSDEPMLETQYEEFLTEKKTQLGGSIFEVRARPFRTKTYTCRVTYNILVEDIPVRTQHEH